MSLYGSAVLAILSNRQQKQAALDAAAAQARAANIAATRAALQNLVPPDDPFRPVAELLAASLLIGREDSYPERSVSKEARCAYEGAVRVLVGRELPKEKKGGLLDLLGDDGTFAPPRANLDRIAQDEHAADYAAWAAARDFRQCQPEIK